MGKRRVMDIRVGGGMEVLNSIIIIVAAIHEVKIVIHVSTKQERTRILVVVVGVE